MVLTKISVQVHTHILFSSFIFVFLTVTVNLIIINHIEQINLENVAMTDSRFNDRNV